MLKGTGTRASKSRLAAFQGARVLFSSTFHLRKEEKKISLASFREEVERKESGRRTRSNGNGLLLNSGISIELMMYWRWRR